MARYLVQNLDSNQGMEYQLTTPFRPAGLLPVPYVSQLGLGASAHRNDCGAACGLMLLKTYRNIQISTDQFYDMALPQGDEYLSVGAVKNILVKYELVTQWKVDLNLADLFGFLQQRKPVMVLFKYGVLRDANLTEKKNFTGPHFGIVVGMDPLNIFINDPYYEGDGGEAHAYPLEIFDKAWEAVGKDPNIPNPTRGALIPLAGMGKIAEDESSSGQKPLYRVRVTAQPYLFVRSGPGQNFPDIGQLQPGVIVRIYSEKSGWGEIESGNWISLDWTQKVL